MSLGSRSIRPATLKRNVLPLQIRPLRRLRDVGGAEIDVGKSGRIEVSDFPTGGAELLAS